VVGWGGGGVVGGVGCLGGGCWGGGGGWGGFVWFFGFVWGLLGGWLFGGGVGFWGVGWGVLLVLWFFFWVGGGGGFWGDHAESGSRNLPGVVYASKNMRGGKNWCHQTPTQDENPSNYWLSKRGRKYLTWGGCSRGRGKANKNRDDTKQINPSTADVSVKKSTETIQKFP